MATITSLVFLHFQEDQYSQKDKESISNAVSKAKKTALMSPSKADAPNADDADQHADKKSKRNLSMGDSSSSRLLRINLPLLIALLTLTS